MPYLILMMVSVLCSIKNYQKLRMYLNEECSCMPSLVEIQDTASSGPYQLYSLAKMKDRGKQRFNFGEQSP